MKKLFITIAFVAAAMFANAQFFVGGNLGMAMENGKIKAVNSGTTVEQDAPKAFTFTFAPSVGFMFNDNMGVGLDLMFGLGKVTEKDYDFDPVATFKTKTTTIGFAPYFRYVFAEVDNFKFYCDARIEYLMSTPKIEAEQGGTTVTIDGQETKQYEMLIWLNEAGANNDVEQGAHFTASVSVKAYGSNDGRITGEISGA